LNFLVRAVHFDQARLNDTREGRVGGGAHLDRLGDIAGEDALLHGRKKDLFVDRRAVQIERALDNDADGDDRPKNDWVHAPATIIEMLPHAGHLNPPDVAPLSAVLWGAAYDENSKKIDQRRDNRCRLSGHRT